MRRLARTCSSVRCPLSVVRRRSGSCRPRDRVELVVGELGDLSQRVARAGELFKHGVQTDAVGGVVIAVGAGAAVVPGVVWRSVPERLQESGGAVAAAVWWCVPACHPVAGLDERGDPLVVVGGVLSACGDGPVAELLAPGHGSPNASWSSVETRSLRPAICRSAVV